MSQLAFSFDAPEPEPAPKAETEIERLRRWHYKPDDWLNEACSEEDRAVLRRIWARQEAEERAEAKKPKRRGK